MQDWNTYRGQIVDGALPLKECLGSTRSTAVFSTTEGLAGSSPVVIKLIHARGVDQDRQLSIWKDISKLTHPNLMRLLRCGRCELKGELMLYAVIDRADEVLGDVLAERPLSPAEAREMLEPLADALSYLHGEGYVHGRVKPGNLFAVDERLKISCESAMPVEAAGAAGREPGVYDAPELGSGVWSAAADSWSLGWTLVESLTKQRLGPGSAIPALPAPFDEIVRRCVDPDPKERWTMARISSCLRGEPAAAASTSSSWKRYAAASVALVLFALWAATNFWSSPASTSEQPAAIEQVASPPPEQPPPAPVPKAGRRVATPPPKAVPELRLPPPARAKRTTASPTPKPPLAAAGQPNPAAAGASEGEIVAAPEVQDKDRRTITGSFRTSVRVDLDASGKVTQARLESPGPSPYFAKLALEAARKSKFSAGEEGRQRLVVFEFSRAGQRVVAVQ